MSRRPKLRITCHSCGVDEKTASTFYTCIFSQQFHDDLTYGFKVLLEVLAREQQVLFLSVPSCYNATTSNYEIFVIIILFRKPGPDLKIYSIRGPVGASRKNRANPGPAEGTVFLLMHKDLDNFNYERSQNGP